MLKKLRMIAVIALCGGTVFQTTGCESLIAPLLTQLITSALTSALSGALIGT